MNFRRSVIIAELWQPEVVDVEKIYFFAFFLEKRRLLENFQNFVQKGFTASPIDVLCSNFVTFGRREMCKIVRLHLPDKKFHVAVQISLLRGSRPKSAKASCRQCTQSASPDFIQIGSLSAELCPNA